ncbi:hypothetical protein MK280_17290 [Myxococcota bacterium]|nr:hypothetical protein [Myxococcota bacterium]
MCWAQAVIDLMGSIRRHWLRRFLFAPGFMIGLLGVGLISNTSAQTPPDLNALVVNWAMGQYASPILCEIVGRLIRGVRRVILKPHQTFGRPVNLEVHFIDLQPEDATRCVNSIGKTQPNIWGKVWLQIPGKPHPETAKRDFKRRLKRDKAFDLEIADGRLKLQGVAIPTPKATVESFRGGRATLGPAMPATDAARELALFKSQRKMLLTLESPSGTVLELPLFLREENGS